jgi:Lrp/AsnC family transcriptional regulator, leucine-responsive regulatory protein
MAAKKNTHQGLDRIDRQILRKLQSDGRLSLTALAEEIHLTVSPCLERVRRLENEGYIRGYAALLDPEKLGRPLLAFVEVRLDRTTPDIFDRFKSAISGIDEVLECHMVAGGFDYLIKIRVQDMAAYRRFLGNRLTALPGVTQTHTYVVMEEVKATHALTI